MATEAPTRLLCLKLHGFDRPARGARGSARSEPFPTPAPAQTTFPFIGIEELKAVPVAVVERLSPVPVAFIGELSREGHLAVVDRQVALVQHSFRLYGVAVCIRAARWRRDESWPSSFFQAAAAANPALAGRTPDSLMAHYKELAAKAAELAQARDGRCRCLRRRCLAMARYAAIDPG